MIDIQFRNIFNNLSIKSLGEISAKATFEQLDLPASSEASILFCDDNTMQMLNKKHRSIEGPTDVLSFPNEGPKQEGGESYLGDIAISVERAVDQAKTAGHSMEAEIQLLVVHGLLHLLGYDHQDEIEKNIMWEAQNRILDRLEINIDQGKIGVEE